MVVLKGVAVSYEGGTPVCSSKVPVQVAKVAESFDLRANCVAGFRVEV